MSDEQNLLIEIVVSACVFAMIGFLLGKARGREGEGAMLGGLLGPIGWLIVLCLADKRRRCPECQGTIPEAARKCLHCGSETPVMVTVKCPACGEVGMVKEKDFGAAFDCPTCRREMRPVRLVQGRAKNC